MVALICKLSPLTQSFVPVLACVRCSINAFDLLNDKKNNATEGSKSRRKETGQKATKTVQLKKWTKVGGMVMPHR